MTRTGTPTPSSTPRPPASAAARTGAPAANARADRPIGTGWATHPQLAGLAAAAVSAARAGCRVFPVRAGSKVPAVRDWENVATADLTQIQSWWAREPSSNIGIACGPSGLVVIDLDDARGQTAPEEWAGARHGADVLARLAAAAGEPVPTETMTVTTPSGGTHLVFRADPDTTIRNSAGTLGWRVDVRAQGGFVVGPGSVRPQGCYRVTRPGPPAALPGWLAAAAAPPRPPVAVTSGPLLLPAGRAGRYLAAIVDGETDTVRAAQPGQRRATLLAAARTLGRLVGGRELTAADAETALLTAAAVHIGIEGFTTGEAEATIAQGMTYGARLPRRVRDEQGGGR